MALGAAAVIALSTVACSVSATPVDTGAMKLFGHSIKNGHLRGQKEIDLLRHNCSAPPCVITQLHCPSASGKYDSVVKLYIDGETVPSIAVTLKELAFVGHLAADAPPAPAPKPPAPSPHDPTVPPNYTEYTLGAMGTTCAQTCAANGLVCSPLINTGYGVDKGKAMQQHLAQFNANITSCIMDSKPWWAADQPGFVCGNDPHGLGGHCVGWHDIPSTGSSCTGSYPQQCRVCRCLSSSGFKQDVSPAEVAGAMGQTASGEPGTGGNGQSDDGPWGETLFGHTAAHGGVYSTIRIPFEKSLRATITSPDPQNATFWFIIRGIEKYPITLGDVELPPSARLRVHHTNLSTAPLELVTLADIPQNMSGAVLAVQADADADSYTYLEACMRAIIDGADEPMFLSSGGEDYFLSAFYYDEGEFRTPTAGLTYKSAGSMSAYKTHDRDPLFFSEGLKLVWRNGEDTVGCGDMQHCPAQYCSPTTPTSDSTAGTSAARASFDGEREAARGRNAEWEVSADKAAAEKGWVPAVYASTVWVYEWPSSAPEKSSIALGENDTTQHDFQWLDKLRNQGLLDGQVAERAESVLRRSDGEAARRLLSVVRAYRVQEGDAARANGARQVARLIAADGRH